MSDERDALIAKLSAELDFAHSLLQTRYEPEYVAKLEAEIAQLKAILDLRTRTMGDINAALVAALDRAEAAESALEAVDVASTRS